MFRMSIRRLNFVIAARQIGVVDSRTIFMKTCFTKLTDDTYTLMNQDLFKQKISTSHRDVTCTLEY